MKPLLWGIITAALLFTAQITEGLFSWSIYFIGIFCVGCMAGMISNRDEKIAKLIRTPKKLRDML